MTTCPVAAAPGPSMLTCPLIIIIITAMTNHTCPENLIRYLAMMLVLGIRRMLKGLDLSKP